MKKMYGNSFISVFLLFVVPVVAGENKFEDNNSGKSVQLENLLRSTAKISDEPETRKLANPKKRTAKKAAVSGMEDLELDNEPLSRDEQIVLALSNAGIDRQSNLWNQTYQSIQNRFSAEKKRSVDSGEEVTKLLAQHLASELVIAQKEVELRAEGNEDARGAAKKGFYGMIASLSVAFTSLAWGIISHVVALASADDAPVVQCLCGNTTN